MIYPTKDCKYDVGVWCQNFHEIDGRLASLEGDTATSVLVNTVSGENVCVNGTVEAPLSNIKLYGKSVQETVPGNQLFDGVFEAGGINNSGIDASNGDRVRGAMYVPVISGNSYVLSWDASYAGRISFVRFYDSDKNFVSGLSVDKGVAFSIPDGVAYLRIQFVVGVDYVDTAVNNMQAMLNKGSTALPWEPYTGGIPSPNPDYPQEIKSVVVNEVKACRKNLLKNTATTQTNKGVTFTVNEDGTVVANGTATSNASLLLYEGIFHDDTILTGGINANARIQIVNLTNNKYTILARDEGNGKNLDLSKFNYGYAEISILSGTVCNNLLFKPMIRLASVTDDTYEPYTENTATLSQPITLNGIGDVMDELTADGVVRKIGSTKISGASGIDSSGKLFKCTPALNTDAKNVTSNTYCLLCEKYLVKTLVDARESDYGIVHYTRSIYIANKDWNYDVDTANTALAESPITVLYELAEPITEPLPEADQIALRSLHSYDGVTHVMCDAEIEVGCLVDTKFYIDSKFAELAAKLGV